MRWQRLYEGEKAKKKRGEKSIIAELLSLSVPQITWEEKKKLQNIRSSDLQLLEHGGRNKPQRDDLGGVFFRAGTLCKGLDSNVYVPNGRLNSSLVRHSFDERVSAQMQRLLSLRRVSVCEMHIVWGFYSSAKVVPLNLNLSCFIWSEKKEKKADGKRRPETEEISITCTGSEAKPRQRASSCQEEYLPWPQWRTTTKRGWTTEAQGNSKGRPNLLEFPYHEETFAEFHQCFLRHLG